MTETRADHEIIDLSAEWLTALEDVPSDWVQHLMVNLGTALVRIGQRADAEATMRRVVEAFPSRSELPRIMHHILATVDKL